MKDTKTSSGSELDDSELENNSSCLEEEGSDEEFKEEFIIDKHSSDTDGICKEVIDGKMLVVFYRGNNGLGYPISSHESQSIVEKVVYSL